MGVHYIRFNRDQCNKTNTYCNQMRTIINFGIELPRSCCRKIVLSVTRNFEFLCFFHFFDTETCYWLADHRMFNEYQKSPCYQQFVFIYISYNSYRYTISMRMKLLSYMLLTWYQYQSKLYLKICNSTLIHKHCVQDYTYIFSNV